MYVCMYMYIYRERQREIQTAAGGGWVGLRIPGVLKKYRVEILGSTEKEKQFPGVIKGCNTVLQNL